MGKISIFLMKYSVHGSEESEINLLGANFEMECDVSISLRQYMGQATGHHQCVIKTCRSRSHSVSNSAPT